MIACDTHACGGASHAAPPQKPGICHIDSGLETDSGPSGPVTTGAEKAGDRIVSFNGERLEVPRDLWDAQTGSIRAEAAVKRALDLRRKLSSASPGEGRGAPPETYEFIVPDDLADRVEADPDHPLAAPAMDWARKNGLSQEAFNELTALFYAEEAAHGTRNVQWRQDQEKQLKEALGENAESIKHDVGRWIGGLLGDTFEKTPGIAHALNRLTEHAEGILLIKALRDKIGEHSVPSGRTGGLNEGISTSDIRALQASQAYLDQSHPRHAATVAKVRESYKRLYPGQ